MAIAVLPALATVLYTAHERHQADAVAARVSLLRLARLTAERQRRALASARSLLYVLSDLDVIQRQDTAGCERLMHDLLRNQPLYANLGAVTGRGRVFCSALPAEAGLDLSDRLYVRRALATGDFSTGEYQVGRITGRPSLNAGYPVTDDGGSVRGVVFAAMDLAALGTLLEDVSLPEGSSLALVDSGGHILYRRPDPERWAGQTMRLGGDTTGTDGQTTFVEGPGLDGVARFFVVSPVSNDTQSARRSTASVVIGVPASAVFGQSDRTFRASLLMLAVSSLLALLAAWLIGDLFVGRRAGRLVGAAARLSQGDLGTRTGLPHRGDELAHIAGAFDHMAESLERRTEELRRTNDQLRQSQKMEAIGRLAGGIAHDFNNALTGIIGYTDLVLARAAVADAARDDLLEVRDSAERAAGLTRQLLAFSREQVLEPRLVDLNLLVQRTEKLLRRVIGEDVDLRVSLGPDLGTVRADPGQLEQVLLNLAVNARDAMPAGGRLVIETANVELDSAFAQTHLEVEPGPYVLLAVSDSGIGMDAATQARIFEPFFTTKEEGKGTGLGLAMVYGIVRQSGGTIWVYSEPGQGATLKVYLPRVSEPAAAPQPAPAVPPLRTGAGTILLVEDSGPVRRVARRALEGLGYEILDVGSPAEALELWDRNAERIRLLLSDIMLPGMNGVDLARRLRADRPGLLVLFISGHIRGLVLEEPLDPATDILTKPFTIAELGRRVGEMLDRRPDGDPAPAAP